jgi:hypothetical protein
MYMRVSSHTNTKYIHTSMHTFHVLSCHNARHPVSSEPPSDCSQQNCHVYLIIHEHVIVYRRSCTCVCVCVCVHIHAHPLSNRASSNSNPQTKHVKQTNMHICIRVCAYTCLHTHSVHLICPSHRTSNH